MKNDENENKPFDLYHPENHPRIPGQGKPGPTLKEIAAKAEAKAEEKTEEKATE